jgi:hypothetical protein
MSEPEAKASPLSRGKKMSWLVVGAALAAGIVFGKFGLDALTRKDEVVDQRPAVISAVRELSRLEGVSFHVERVVDLRDKQESMFGLVRGEDAILLVASGDVVAGVDLGGLRPGDVVVDHEKRTARLTLPPAEVFSARLDNERTQVHTRKTDFFAKRKESLETEARQAAERTLREAAEEGGIREKAQQSVERTVRTLVRSLGFERVDVSFREAS